MRRLHLVLLFYSVFAAGAGSSRGQEVTLASLPKWEMWRDTCLALPSNQQILQQTARGGKSAISATQFEHLLQKFFASELTGSLAQADRWSEGKPAASFYDRKAVYFQDPALPFIPFAQKLTLSPASRVIFNGDLHGDIRSLIATLRSLQQRGVMEGFKVVQPDTHLVFLGDYTDRGYYGVEVVATLLRLKVENPDNVWLSRGNHEDFQLVERYGFADEIQRKFGAGYEVSKIVRVFDCLPVVIYVGSTSGDYLQCNHGGMEVGFDPGALLKAPSGVAYQVLGKLKQTSFNEAHPELLNSVGMPERNMLQRLFSDFTPKSPATPRTLGFMWNDFTVFSDEPSLAYVENRGWLYGQKGTALVLKAHSTPEARVRAVFRAHQHTRSVSPMMQRLLVSNGIFQHWQEADTSRLATAPQALLGRLVNRETIRSVRAGAVYTFNVSPDSVYGIGCYYNFATHGILTMAPAFDDWKIEVVPLPIALD